MIAIGHHPHQFIPEYAAEHPADAFNAVEQDLFSTRHPRPCIPEESFIFTMLCIVHPPVD
ncbi:MAG: hypothetical protein GX911_05920 [Spirochaetales bacterium]|nr:hypothetical protein [Spirochaetales bacterium]